MTNGGSGLGLIVESRGRGALDPIVTFLERQSYIDDKQIMEWGIGSNRLGWIPVNMHLSKRVTLYSAKGQSESVQMYLCIV